MRELTELSRVGFACFTVPRKPFSSDGRHLVLLATVVGRASQCFGPWLTATSAPDNGASGLLILIPICFADQMPGTRGRGGTGWAQCRGPGAQPRTGGFVHSYEENTKCINLSIYLHVFLKGSLPEITHWVRCSWWLGGNSCYILKTKKKEKKKRKMFLKRSYIFCYFCCFIFLNYVLNLFSV